MCASLTTFSQFCVIFIATTCNDMQPCSKSQKFQGNEVILIYLFLHILCHRSLWRSQQNIEIATNGPRQRRDDHSRGAAGQETKLLSTKPTWDVGCTVRTGNLAAPHTASLIVPDPRHICTNLKYVDYHFCSNARKSFRTRDICTNRTNLKYNLI